MSMSGSKLHKMIYIFPQARAELIMALLTYIKTGNTVYMHRVYGWNIAYGYDNLTMQRWATAYGKYQCRKTTTLNK